MRLTDTVPSQRTNARRLALRAFTQAFEPAREARRAGAPDPAAEAALVLAVEALQSVVMIDLALDVQDLMRTFPHVHAITWTQQRVGVNAQITVENADALPPPAHALLRALPRDALLEIFGPGRITMTAAGVRIDALE